jgi:hypothetical protein
MQVTHTYDVHPRLTAVTGSTAERGPLAASNEIVVAGAVDRGSQGPSARSHLSRAVGAATDYDRMTRPAQINTRWAKTGLEPKPSTECSAILPTWGLPQTPRQPTMSFGKQD